MKKCWITSIAYDLVSLSLESNGATSKNKIIVNEQTFLL
jgi:hypothetical protein